MDGGVGNKNMDLNPLIRLKEAIEGAQKNSTRMVTKLEKFEKKLEELDVRMRPIQLTTERYTKAKEKIAATLQEVNKTYEFFRVAADVKEVISQGYISSQLVTSGNAIATAQQQIQHKKDYLEAVVRLASAKSFFQTHKEIKSASSVLMSVDGLLTVSLPGFIYRRILHCIC